MCGSTQAVPGPGLAPTWYLPAPPATAVGLQLPTGVSAGRAGGLLGLGPKGLDVSLCQGRGSSGQGRKPGRWSPVRGTLRPDRVARHQVSGTRAGQGGVGLTSPYLGPHAVVTALEEVVGACLTCDRAL